MTQIEKYEFINNIWPPLHRKTDASVAAAQHSLTNDSEIFLYAQPAARNL